MAYSPSTNNYVQNATGVWTPVGLAAGSLAMPTQIATTAQLAAGIAASAQPHGALRVTPDPTSIFYDAFDAGALDTTDKWTTSGTAPTLSAGALTFPASTFTTTSILVSRPTIVMGSSQYVFAAFVLTLETGTGTGAGRFWGLGSVPTTPSSTSLAQEGVGFSVDATSGALQAVTWTGGAKTVIATLTKPTDGANHRYSMQYRNSRTYWFIDDINVHVATSTFLNTSVQSLPVLLSSVTTGTLTNGPVMTTTAVGVSDLNRNATQLADGVNPWRKATVRSTGALDVNLASSSGNIASVSGALTVASAISTTQTASSTSGVLADISSAGNATITVATTGTTAAGLVFEATLDPTGTAANWFSVDFTRADGSAVETRATVTGTSITAWNVMAPGYKFLRVRLATVTTAGTIAVVIQQGPFLIDPSPAAVLNPLAPLQGPSASPGSVPTPAYLSIATVTNTALVAAPATGLSIYVTDMEGSNSSAALTTTTFFEGTTTAKYTRSMAASGGGFVTNLKTPWKLAAATALTLTQSAANQGYYTANYYVAP